MIEGLLIKHAMDDLQRLFTDPSASRKMIDERARGIAGAPPGNASALGAGHAASSASSTPFWPRRSRRPAAGGAAAGSRCGHQATPVTRERAGPANAFDITFPQGVMWGIIGCVMSFAISLVSERVHGTFVRLQMAPLTRAQILGGKALGVLRVDPGARGDALRAGHDRASASAPRRCAMLAASASAARSALSGS